MKSALHSPLADDWIRGALRLIAATLVAAAGSAVTDRRYNWDAEQRMVSVDSGSTASYVYNALGERVEKHVGTSYTEYIFNPQQIQADASDRSASCCAWEYLFFGARRFGKYASNETYLSHPDKIHTMGTVTDYTGAVVQDAIYHPWGQEWTMAGTMMDERFASLNQRDSESSLDPTHFRMMSSYVGRWMSPDPAKGCLKNPQNHDRYAYVVNGPTGRIDPHGDQLCDPFTDPFCDLGGGYCDPYLDPFCGYYPFYSYYSFMPDPLGCALCRATCASLFYQCTQACLLLVEDPPAALACETACSAVYLSCSYLTCSPFCG